MELFGTQHQALLEWLSNDWWSKGPPVALLQGFPGIGKTEIALRMMEQLLSQNPLLPMTRFICPETRTGAADDLLLTIGEELAANGDGEIIEKLERGEDTVATFSMMLLAPRLIIVDEAQRLLVGSTGTVSATVASYLERWSTTVGAAGRLLLISNREFDYARWNERVERNQLYPLKPKEAEKFLLAELIRHGLVDSVPAPRFSEIVSWLGCNQRAIRLLVSALAREKLDELIGLAPEVWEARYRPVAPGLLREFEKAVLERAQDRLDQEAQLFVRRLSVLRRPVDRRALQALSPAGADVNRLCDDLLARFMVEFRSNHYDMHPVLRDTIRQRVIGAELRRAHLAAGRYYAAAFRARRMVGEAEKLGARFIEARYHFAMAENERELAEISYRFEAHFRSQFYSTSPVPIDPEERNERIALLSALLQSRGAKGLEEYLARCLVARNQPGDVERALPHIRRATGPQASVATWILRIRLENQLFGATQAAKIAREAINISAHEVNLGDIFYVTAELLAGAGKPNEAIELLQRGIKHGLVAHSRALVQRTLGKLLATEGDAGAALDLLRRSIEEAPPGQDRSELQLEASQILNSAGKSNEAIALLQDAISDTPPGQPRTDLALAAAEMLDRTGRRDDALTLLHAELNVATAGTPRAFIEHAINRILAVSGWTSTPPAALPSGAPNISSLENLPQPVDEQIVPAQATHGPTTTSLFDSERIVRAMRPDEWFGLYVLGCYDHVKTVYVQQCRALTLIHALFETGELEAGRRLGIVGGGAAGLTAAAAAAVKGANVVLFERTDTLMTLQRNNIKRYLHPHLYHWPASDSLEPDGGLPILNWHAGRSDEVAHTITSAFEAIRNSSQRIELCLGKSIQDVDLVSPDQETRRVQIIGAEGEINEFVDVGIIAIGFGVEPKRPLGVDTPAYWENDGLDQVLVGSPDHPQRILISGAGDGAMIDIMRATLRDFEQGKILEFLPQGLALETVEMELEAIETAASRAALRSSFRFFNLHQKYGELQIDQTIIERIKSQIRNDTEVWFNFTSPGRYVLGSSLINRFIVSILCRLGAVRPKLARLTDGSISLQGDGKYLVSWSNSTEPQVFDKIVIRHGPSLDYLGSVFPKIGDACAPLRGKLRELDLTASLHELTRRFFST